MTHIVPKLVRLFGPQYLYGQDSEGRYWIFSFRGWTRTTLNSAALRYALAEAIYKRNGKDKFNEGFGKHSQ